MNKTERANAFRALHEQDGAFIIPNPWDAGSARLLQAMGFKALATTSSGYANSIGLVDGEITRDQKIAHCRSLSAATPLPINADLENCFAHDPEDAARTITMAAEAGVVGGSIEDYTNDPAAPLYDFNHAVERVEACVAAARALDFPFMLTARAEGLLHRAADLDDTLRRLQAFEAAGADVLYAPALRTLDEVRTVTSSVNKPVNVLSPPLKGVSVQELADAGAKRISIGGALARALTGTLLRAGREMAETGTFEWVNEAAPNSEIEKLLGG